MGRRLRVVTVVLALGGASVLGWIGLGASPASADNVSQENTTYLSYRDNDGVAHDCAIHQAVNHYTDDGYQYLSVTIDKPQGYVCANDYLQVAVDYKDDQGVEREARYSSPDNMNRAFLEYDNVASDVRTHVILTVANCNFRAMPCNLRNDVSTK